MIYYIDSRRDLLSMYLPQEAHKSYTAPFAVIGGVVSRPAADAVENSLQIADKLSTIYFWRKIKKDSILAFFTIRENH